MKEAEQSPESFYLILDRPGAKLLAWDHMKSKIYSSLFLKGEGYISFTPKYCK
jgi:hypothetical protein